MDYVMIFAIGFLVGGLVMEKLTCRQYDKFLKDAYDREMSLYERIDNGQ